LGTKGNIPVEKLATDYKCHKDTVKYWMNEITFKDKKHTGRPPNFDVEHYKSLVKENPRASYRSIQKLWNKGSPPSISTISEWKNKLGVKDYSDHIQHQLTEEQKEKRVKIAKLHKGKLKKKSVMFVDETSCSNQFIHHRLHVLPGEEPDYTKLIKEKGLSGHFFAGISYNSKSDLYGYSKKFNSGDYQKALETVVIPNMDRIYGWSHNDDHRLWFLCQDNDPAHVSKDTKEFMDVFGIRVWDHPSWSADMNPIEYLWGVFWHRIGLKNPLTSKQLLSVAQEVWKDITQDEIRNFINKLDDI